MDNSRGSSAHSHGVLPAGRKGRRETPNTTGISRLPRPAAGVEPRGNPLSHRSAGGGLLDVPLGPRVAGRTTEVVRGADADDDGRASADPKPLHGARSDAEGERSGHARYLPPPHPRLGVPAASAVGGSPSGVIHSLYPWSSGRAGRSGVEDEAIVDAEEVEGGRLGVLSGFPHREPRVWRRVT